MNMTEILRVLIDETGLSIRKFAENCNLPHTTIHGMFRNGCEKSSISTVISICDELHVNIEDVRKLSQKENVTKEDILSLKDKYIEKEYISLQDELKERPELMKLLNSFKRLDTSMILSLSESINNASPEDIAMISDILKRITEK